MNDNEKFLNDQLPDSTDYQKFLLTWIFDLGVRNKESFNYDTIKDIAIGIYLLCKDLKESISDDNKFIKYFNNHYGYGSLVYKLLSDIQDKKPDLLEILSEISDTNYNNNFMTLADLSKHLETLYNTEKLSEEQNKETLLFGDNILNNEMSIRELCDTVRMMDIDYVSEYIKDLNLGDITFTISDTSIMYLKDTYGIKIASMYMDNGNRHIIRYTNENGTALFLLFEPLYIKNETIYGLSLDSTPDEERGLLILEKNKDENLYKFIFGGEN